MAQLIGHKFKIAVFISGRGSNLKNLLNFSKKNKTNWKISLVISNKKSAKGIKYAQQFKIPHKIFENKIKIFEKKALIALKKKKINILCLAGFMRILSKTFIKKLKIKILNIHPSLLPKYKGMNTHERVIQKKEKFTGCTVHYVTAKLDSGKTIIQKKVRVYKKDNPKTLSKKVLLLEHRAYPEALQKICS